MGREIKRVPLDFDWPRGVTWPGFLCPYHSSECPYCKGSGYSPEAKKIADDWYDLDRTGARWCDAITQDEVDALVAHERLYDFTHTWADGWKRRADGYVPTAAEVNAWQAARRGIGHDGINRGICVEARCKRLGLVKWCAKCGGDGELWASPEVEKLAEDWKRTEPPAGDGWQVWQTVGEGAPISPVFATAEDLARHLSTVGDDWAVKRNAERRGSDPLPTYDSALAFVTAGWAPSLSSNGTAVVDSYGTDHAAQPGDRPGDRKRTP